MKNRASYLCFLTLFGCLLFAGNLSAQVVVFNDNFDGALPAEISGPVSLTGVQGFAGLGPVGNQFGGNFLRNSEVPADATTLTLFGLPAHTSIDLDFLLAIVDSWDGDQFIVSVDGNPILDTRFENSGVGTQTYVAPAGVELARKVNLGFTPDGFWLDSAYNMGLDPIFDGIPHTSDSLTVTWIAGDGWQGNNDEFFAIDNLSVTLNGIPEPSSLAVLGLAALWVGSKRRRSS